MNEEHQEQEAPDAPSPATRPRRTDGPAQPPSPLPVETDLQEDELSAPGHPPSTLSPADFPNAPAAVTEAVAAGRPAMPARGATEQRGMVHSIHYLLSYLVRSPELGPRGAIVLLHDLPGGAFTWASALPKLDTAGRAVYAFDLLGFGESEYPWPSDTSIWGHADCLRYAFKKLGFTDITLVGVGVGAAVAQVLATRMYREGVARLVLVNSYGYEYAYAPNWPLPEMEKRHDPEAPKHTPLDAVLSDLRATLPQGSARPQSLNGSTLDAYVNAWRTEVGKEMLFQHVRLMVPSYLNAVGSDLGRLTIPVLLVWSEGDAVTPLWLGQRMAREIPGARLETLKDAGHLILDDAPAALGSLLADFAR